MQQDNQKCPEYIKSITKHYKNTKKIILYKKTWKKPQPHDKDTIDRIVKTRKLNKQLTDTQKYEHKVYRSINRAKTSIADIISCNTFDYFVTLTIDPNNKYNVDRYDYDSSSKAITKWLRKNSTSYILVPEKHKDGAFHFHLLANLTKDQLTHFKKNIYNINTYKLGYSTAIKTTKGSEERIANYMRKYITKQLISTVGFNKKRYWTSRGLKRPHTTYNDCYEVHVKSPTLFTMRAKIAFTTEYFDIYNAPINPLPELDFRPIVNHHKLKRVRRPRKTKHALAYGLKRQSGYKLSYTL